MLPILLFSLICLAFTSHFGWLHNPFTAATNGEPADEIPPSPFHPDLIDFWDLTSRALVETKPDCSLPTDPIEAPPLNESASLKKDVDFRPDLLQIPQRDVDIMRDVHAHFVSQIPELAQNLPYVNGTQGVVVAASGALLPVFLVSLRMLRRTGSILPVEVFIESKERYEKEICEIVLPPMNATCMILSEVLEAVPLKLEMSGYQLRVLALAFSSFEDVLLLDADNLPLEQPEHLLNAEPFSSKGFVSWPDYVCLFHSTPPTSPLLPPPPLKANRQFTKGGQHRLPEILRHHLAARPANHRARRLRSRPAAPIKAHARAHRPPNPLLQPLWPEPLLQITLPANPHQSNRSGNRQRNLPGRGHLPQRLLLHRHDRDPNTRLHASARQAIRPRGDGPAQPHRRLQPQPPPQHPRQQHKRHPPLLPPRKHHIPRRLENVQRLHRKAPQPAHVGHKGRNDRGVRAGRGEAGVGRDAVHGVSFAGGV